MSQLSPRRLGLLRIEDGTVFSAIQNPDFPLEIVGTIKRWSDFLWHLKNPDTFQCDLLAIDIQFDKDPSGPPIEKEIEISIDQFMKGRYDPNPVSKELGKDPVLSKLVWAPALRCFGKNTGIVIGSLLAGYCLDRDLPVGVGVHTGYHDLPACDVTTAMLLAQILAASGVFLELNDDQKILRQAVQSLSSTEFRRRLEDVLPEMLERFRVAFRHRAGQGQHILVEQESLDQLMAIFHSVSSLEELDQNLSLHGIKFYDREGREDCLDLRSVFADKLLDTVTKPGPYRLPLEMVKPPNHDQAMGGEIYQFIHELYSGELSYVTPIITFFERFKNGEDTQDFAEFKKPMHKIIALLFAWCYVQAESWGQDAPWDPMENQQADGESGFASRLAQVRALLHILCNLQDEEEGLWAKWDAKSKHVPLSHDRQLSIMGAVKRYCKGRGDLLDKLFLPLRYDRTDDRSLSGRRQTAVLHLLEDLVRSKHLDEVVRNGVKWFKVINAQPPKHIYGQTDRRRILEVLGFSTADLYVPFDRILELSPITEFGNATSKEFFNNLENGRLPSRFAKLCQHFMKAVWREIPESGWPPCIRDAQRRSARPSVVTFPNQCPKDQEQAKSELLKFMLLEGFSSCKAGYYYVKQASGDVGRDLIRMSESADGTLSLIFMDAPSLAMRLYTIIDLLPEAHHDPEKMFSVLNTSSIEGILVPFVHITISPDRRTMKYVNASHEHPLVLQADGGETSLGATTGRLGQSAQQQANQKTEKLCPGDRIVIYSDGLSNATNEEGVQFSRLRIADAAAKNLSLDAKEMTEAILDDARSFCNCPWKDDVTLAVIAL